MKIALLILLLLTVAWFALGWWSDRTARGAEDRMGAAVCYAIGTFFGALLMIGLIVKAIFL